MVGRRFVDRLYNRQAELQVTPQDFVQYNRGARDPLEIPVPVFVDLRRHLLQYTPTAAPTYPLPMMPPLTQQNMMFPQRTLLLDRGYYGTGHVGPAENDVVGRALHTPVGSIVADSAAIQNNDPPQYRPTQLLHNEEYMTPPRNRESKWSLQSVEVNREASQTDPVTPSKRRRSSVIEILAASPDRTTSADEEMANLFLSNAVIGHPAMDPNSIRRDEIVPPSVAFQFLREGEYAFFCLHRRVNVFNGNHIVEPLLSKIWLKADSRATGAQVLQTRDGSSVYAKKMDLFVIRRNYTVKKRGTDGKTIKLSYFPPPNFSIELRFAKEKNLHHITYFTPNDKVLRNSTLVELYASAPPTPTKRSRRG